MYAYNNKKPGKLKMPGPGKRIPDQKIMKPEWFRQFVNYFNKCGKDVL
jgi:hypothetical protein